MAVPQDKSAKERPGGAAVLFTPTRLGRLDLKNRVVVAPMTRVSATPEGCAADDMAAYYAAFAAGGFGLVITEGIYTDRAYAQGYLNQPGLTDRAQVAAWRHVVKAVHAHDVPVTFLRRPAHGQSRRPRSV